ncbi:MAG: AMP-binding protein [Burkholderiales bacterium]|nr:MAG: AMP-binding protein [Burkholderiales bacterium]
MRVLGDIPRLGAKRHPDRVALVFGDDKLTYAELDAAANRFAAILAANGVVAGDRVALLDENTSDFPVAVFAVLKLGAILVPLNFRYTPDELAYVVNDATPRCLLVGQGLAALAGQASAGFARPVLRIELDTSVLRTPTGAAPPEVSVDPTQIAMVMYTSGTTGFPKGVLFSHAAYLTSITAIALEGDLRETDRVLVSLPLFHNGGLNALMNPALALGACAFIAAKGFVPQTVLGWVEQHRITLTMFVPTMLAMLIASGELPRFDTSSLKKIWYGSSPITPALLEQVRTAFQAQLYQFYGMTETGMNAVLRPEHHDRWAHCTGREVFCADLRIVDAHGQDVAVGEIGEIISRQQPMGMVGYMGNERATAETIVDGWIHTGDLARNEGEGIFTVVDRKKDMLISGAENVYPKEIEVVIAELAGVLEVAVFGIPDPVYGEAVCAAIVPRGAAGLTEQEVVAWCAQRLAGYKKPKRVLFLDALPKNAAGKVLKHVLKAPFWEERERRI